MHLNYPGYLLPGRKDHGHGPLALVIESCLEPGTRIPSHEHRNDEIISWVPDGVMRHDDAIGGKLVTDRDHLLVMNAGLSCWHEERTNTEDPPLRMLQIFVRPQATDLPPKIQHGALKSVEANAWRHLVGPDGSAAPFHVRNDVHLFDIRLKSGAVVVLPQAGEWDLYFYVFTGTIEVGGTYFTEAESGIAQRPNGDLGLRATQPSTVVAFLLNPKAAITRDGTIGG
jgi:hypothetical protein